MKQKPKGGDTVSEESDTERDHRSLFYRVVNELPIDKG